MSAKRPTVRARIGLLLAVIVFLLPVYGSWIDATYAAREPDHYHIYLGKIDPFHHRSSPNGDVVNLPNQDATSQSVGLLLLPVGQLVRFSAESELLSFGLSDEYLSPEDTFLPPPDHPPRI